MKFNPSRGDRNGVFTNFKCWCYYD